MSREHLICERTGVVIPSSMMAQKITEKKSVLAFHRKWSLLTPKRYGKESNESPHFNRLTELPKEIGNLTNFNCIKSIEITEFPKEIGNLTYLTELNIYSNQLTELPKEFENLTNLIELKFDNNQLAELPKEI
ncbi:hypothetical protein H8356DRAFT_1406044 [Neocallimastix lanati (nom. inval.)]|nr:hypothetical protein H8356DRAFT_1406044 [Neocallimastix sp. JGI-2020a]